MYYRDFDQRILPHMKIITQFINMHEKDSSVFCVSSRIDNSECCIFCKNNEDVETVECLAVAGFHDGSWLGVLMDGTIRSFTASEIV